MNNQYFDQADVQEHKGLGILMAVASVLFIIPCIAGSLKNSTYLRFRANQSCIVFLFGVLTGLICSIIGKILGIIPLLGGLVAGLISGVFFIITLVLVIINVVNAATEETQGKTLPVIGSIEIIK